MNQRASNNHKRHMPAFSQVFSCCYCSPLDTFFWLTAIIAISLVALSGLVLTTFRVSADDHIPTTASITVSSFCSMTATTDSAHETDISPGVFQGNIGKTTFATICNDTNGYDVYAVGFTNDEFGRNDMLGSSTGRIIDTGTINSGESSSWSMKLTSVSSEATPTITTGYSDYHAVPDGYTKVVSYDGSTMAEPAGSKFETTYGSYIGSKQVADTYVGKVKYTLVHPSDPSSAPCEHTFTVNYNSNGGSGNMTSQTICENQTFSILANGFTSPDPVGNYRFVKWNTETDGSGVSYTPGQSVMNLVDPNGSITLYALWSPRYIQDLTSATCSIMANDRSITVYDRRDGKDYAVRYLEGACWMVQNLRITGTVNKQYSNFSTYDYVDVCENDLTAGDSYNEPRCHDSGNTTNGVWYNYAAASAKTILMDGSSSATTEDICPANWHLPTSDSDRPAGSIQSLLSLDSIHLADFRPIMGGRYSSGSLSNVSYSGSWWSSVYNGSSNRVVLMYSNSSLSTSFDNRQFGDYIRCVRE